MNNKLSNDYNSNFYKENPLAAAQKLREACFAIIAAADNDKMTDVINETVSYPFDIDLTEKMLQVAIWSENLCHNYNNPKDTERRRPTRPSAARNAEVDGWYVINTGGNCMVWYKDFSCFDGGKRLVAMTDETIALYDGDYDMYGQWDATYEHVEAEWYYKTNEPSMENFSEIFGLWLSRGAIANIIETYLLFGEEYDIDDITDSVRKAKGDC